MVKIALIGLTATFTVVAPISISNAEDLDDLESMLCEIFRNSEELRGRCSTSTTTACEDDSDCTTGECLIDDFREFIDHFLNVTAYPGRPGCEVNESGLEVANDAAFTDFKVRFVGTFDNNSTGLQTCTSGSCLGDDCDDTGSLCVNCSCAVCDCCVDSEQTIAAGESVIAFCDMPGGCTNGDCDNQTCVAGDNQGQHCVQASECYAGLCVASKCPDQTPCNHASECPSACTGTVCPTCGYHCTELDETSVTLQVLEIRCDGTPWTVVDPPVEWTEESGVAISSTIYEGILVRPAPSCS